MNPWRFNVVVLAVVLAASGCAAERDADATAILVQNGALGTTGTVAARVQNMVQAVRERAREALAQYPQSDLIVTPEYSFYPKETTSDPSLRVRLLHTAGGEIQVDALNSYAALATAVADMRALAVELGVWMFLGTLPVNVPIAPAKQPQLAVGGFTSVNINALLVIDPAGRIAAVKYKSSGSDYAHLVPPPPPLSSLNTAQTQELALLVNSTSRTHYLSTRQGWPMEYLAQICAERISGMLHRTVAGAQAELLIESSREGDFLIREFAPYVQQFPGAVGGNDPELESKKTNFDRIYYLPYVQQHGIVRPDGVLLLNDAVGNDAAGLYMNLNPLPLLDYRAGRWTAVGFKIKVLAPEATVTVSGPARFTVSLSTPPATQIAVKLGYGGTAAPGTHYTALPGTVTFQPGETLKHLTVQALAGGSSKTVVANVLTGGGYLPGSPAQATLTLGSPTAPPANQAPVAADQSVTARRNIVQSILLSATDSDSSGPLTYTILTLPAHGVLSGSGAMYSYVPDIHYSGPDSFTFRVSDGQADSNIATVSITVGPNDAPIAYDLHKNTQLALSLWHSFVYEGAMDPNEDPLSFVLVSGPAHGTLSGTWPNLTYQPDAGHRGADSFTWKVNDGSLDSNVATFSIYVNTAPVADDRTYTVNVNQSITISLTGSDFDGDPLTVEVQTTSGHYGMLSGALPNLTYTAPPFSGSDRVTFTVRDTRGGADIGYIDITVTGIGEAKTIVDDLDANTSRTGTWSLSSATKPWAGQSLQQNAGGAFRWIPNVPEAGTYNVYGWWTYASSRSTDVPYEIRHAEGSDTVTVNQRDFWKGGRWNLLGTYSFHAGSGGYVQVASSNGQACADAVMLAKIGPFNTTPEIFSTPTAAPNPVRLAP